MKLLMQHRAILGAALVATLGGCALESGEQDEAMSLGVTRAALTTATSIDTAADTKLSFVLPVLNFGTQTSLSVNGTLWPDWDRTLIRFDTTAIQQAIGTSGFTSAKLRFTITGVPAATWGAAPAITVHRMLQTWSETGATWANTLAFQTPFNADPVCTVAVMPGQTGQIECDVTSDVVAMLGGDVANHGWILQETSATSGIAVALGSRQAANAAHRPKLVVETDENDPEPEPLVDTSVPGRLIVDATNGGTLDLPETGMTFASEEDLNVWAIEHLNAFPVLDSNGALIGVEGELLQIGRLGHGDADTRTTVDVDDYIAAILGGREGVVTVGGIPHCLKEEGCDPELVLQAQPPSKATVCDPGVPNYCIEGWSFKKNWVFYNSIGTEVEQTRGGFQESCRLCWKAYIIPWRCCSHSGSNSLGIGQQLRFSTEFGSSGTIPLERQRDNVECLTHKLWSFFVSVKNTGAPGKPEGTAEAELTGVCGVSTSTNPPQFTASTRASTSTGNVTDVCDSVLPPD